MNKGEVYEIKKQKNRKNTSVDCEYYFDFSRNLNVYGFFERQLEAIFLTPEFISLTLSKFGDAFFLYTGIDTYRMVGFFIKFPDNTKQYSFTCTLICQSLVCQKLFV